MEKYKIAIRDITEIQQLELVSMNCNTADAKRIFSSFDFNFKSGYINPKFKSGYLVLYELVENLLIYKEIMKIRYDK